MSDLATVLDLQGHYDDALVLVQQAVDLSRSAGHPDQHILMGNMAGILLHKGQEKVKAYESDTQLNLLSLMLCLWSVLRPPGGRSAVLPGGP